MASEAAAMIVTPITLFGIWRHNAIAGTDPRKSLEPVPRSAVSHGTSRAD